MTVRLKFVGTLLLMAALTGCGMHKKTPPPFAPQAQAPDLSKNPLSGPDAAEKAPELPALPGTSPAPAQPAPPAQPVAKKRVKRIKPPASKPPAPTQAETAPAAIPPARESAASSGPVPAATGGGDAGTQSAGTSVTAPAQQVAMKPAEGDLTASSIGQLTTGTTPDTAVSRRDAGELIRSTEKGVSGIHRSLSTDEKKVVAQIKSFLQQAQKALDNGDADGAQTLATKAKVLLTELTGEG